MKGFRLLSIRCGSVRCGLRLRLGDCNLNASRAYRRTKRLFVTVVEVEPNACGNRDDYRRDCLKLQASHQPAALMWAAATRAWTATRNCAWLAMVACPLLICDCAVDVSAM